MSRRGAGAEREVDRAANTAWLRDRFFARLLAREPRSVLDVGCGDGALLARCREHGIAAVGIEATPADAAEARAAGSTMVAASAQRLPCAERSFDWVAIRHVLHHLHDPTTALAEAFRVCSHGVIVAEPWLDLGIASQRAARRLDVWLKRQHTRLGHTHGPDLEPAEIIARAPRALRGDVEVDIVLRLRRRPLAEIDAEAGPCLEDLPADDPERVAFDEWRRALAEDGVTQTGSAIVSMERARDG